MNWGGFAGGLAQGLNTGLSLGGRINDLVQQDKIAKIREQGLAEAQRVRQAELDSAAQNVVESSAPATGQVAPDRPEAYTQAVPQPPSLTDTRSAPAPDSALGAVPQASTAPTAAMVGFPSVANPAPASGSASTAANAGLPALEATAPPAAPKAFMVGNQGFDTREAATKAAQKNVGSEKDFFLKVAVPQISQKLTELGEVDKAQAWDQYARQEQTQANMDTWAKMARAAQSGNYEKAADHAFELYKHYDDGVTPVGKEVVKDDSGNVTGFNVKLKDDATGEERSQFIGTREIVDMGLSALSPPAMFNQMYQRQTSADALAAKGRLDAQNDARTLARDVAKQGLIENRADKRQAAKMTAEAAQAERQHGYKLEELTTAENLRQAGAGKAEQAKLQAKIDLLKNNGYTPEAVKELLPALMNVGEFKKGTSPEERRAMFVNELAKDPLFTSKSTEEKNKAVNDLMAVAGVGAEPRRTPKPAAAEAPAAPAANPQAGKTPVFDTKTGQIIYK